MNWSKVAREIEVSPVTLWRWRKRPDFPKNPTPADVHAYAESVRTFRGRPRAVPRRGSAGMAELRREKLIAEIERLNQQLAAGRAQVIREARQELLSEVMDLLREFRRCLHSLPFRNGQKEKVNAALLRCLAVVEKRRAAE